MCYTFRLLVVGWLWVLCTLSLPLWGQSLLPIYTVKPDSIDRLIPRNELQATLIPHGSDWETLTRAHYKTLDALPTPPWYARTPTDLCIHFGLYNPTADTIRLRRVLCMADYISEYRSEISEEGSVSTAGLMDDAWFRNSPDRHVRYLVLPPRATVAYYHIVPYYRHDKDILGLRLFSLVSYYKQAQEGERNLLPAFVSSIVVLSILGFLLIFFGIHHLHIRSTVKGWYLGYIVSIMLFLLYHLERHFSVPILIGHWPQLLTCSEGIFVTLSNVAYLGFLRSFFDLQHRSSRYDRWIRAAMVTVMTMMGTLIAAEMFLYWQNYAQLIFPIWEVLLMSIQLAALILFLRVKRSFSEKMVLVGVFFLLLGTGITAAIPFEARAAWLGQNHLIFLKIGVLIETIFFSLALVIKSRDELLQSQCICERIARDLHDEIGSLLSSIHILSATVPEARAYPSIQQRLDLIGERSRESITLMNDIVWNVNPKHETLAKMVGRLKNYAVEVLESQETALHFDISPAILPLGLPMEQRRNFWLIAKEALHNVAKYAHAPDVWVKMYQREQTLHMEVADNGIGFDLESAKHGNGLGNMHARAQNMGGRLAIFSEVGRGTRLELATPIP